MQTGTQQFVKENEDYFEMNQGEVRGHGTGGKGSRGHTGKERHVKVGQLLRKFSIITEREKCELSFGCDLRRKVSRILMY